MGWTRAMGAVLATDARRLLRDRFLLGASVYIMACALALRWLLPWLQGEVLSSSEVDIASYFGLGVSYFVLINASVLTGMVGGFLLLETREERTVKALLVTPTSLTVPLGTLMGVVLLSGTLIAFALGLAVGVGVPDPGAALTAALVGAPTGIVMMLILATVASNKVEAFAVMKMTSFLGLLPVGAYFLPEPWQYLAGVVPPYWACKMWWLAEAGEAGWAWMVVPGLLVSAAWIFWLLGRFRAAAYR